jgi:hypothetical protein
MKKCRKCGENKDLSEFYKGVKHKGGYRHICRECVTVEARKYRQTPGWRAYLKKYNQSDKGKATVRRYELKRKYGITKEDYDNIHKQQQGRCAICGEIEARLEKMLVVDHCHASGKVRGLLCTNCNFLIGHAKDNLDVLASAASYLINSKLLTI